MELLLTLKKMPFDVMLKELKPEEFRAPSDWIKSRLVGKSYKTVRFANGYGKKVPQFVAEYKGYEISKIMRRMCYPNGLVVWVLPGDYIIKLGRVLAWFNIS